MGWVDWLVAWPNVAFTVVGGATVAFAAVQASGILGLLAGGGDHDADGHDADGHDADGADGHDADGADGHDADGHDADGHDADGHASIGEALLAPLAIGRVPLTLTAESGALAFALAGLTMNSAYLASPGGPPLVSLAWTLPASILVGYGAAAIVARVLSPIVDDRPHAATSRRELVGAIGVVISSGVTEEFGEVRVRDRSGHDVRVVCRLAAGSRALTEREEAVIVDVDGEGRLFVAPFEAVMARVDGEDAPDAATTEKRARQRAR